MPVGKPGTVKPEEFATIESLCAEFDPKLLATKVSKMLTKKAEVFLHECPSSAIGAAYMSTASKISSRVGSVRGLINRENYNTLGKLVDAYGPEVVINKLAKGAKRANKTADATLLKSVFAA